MSEIKIDRYMSESIVFYSFYQYCEQAFSSHNLYEELKEFEFENMKLVLGELKLKGVVNEELIFDGKLEKEIIKTLDSNITDGFSILRRQLLEASYSNFERFLNHIVRVYLHLFPQILKDIDKQISFLEVGNLHQKGDSVFDYVIEKEIDNFSRKSLFDKKKYLLNRLLHKDQETVWEKNGNDMWKDIDKKRQAIVHKDTIPKISKDYLLRANNCLQRIMFGIAFTSFFKQGVPLIWVKYDFSDFKKIELKLR